MGTRPIYHPSSERIKQLNQYASTPGYRDYCYAELAIFSPNSGRSHRQYSVHLPMNEGMARLS